MNIGTVIYSHGKIEGTLDAVWYHDELGNGYGFAEGGCGKSFEGEFNISYYNNNGNLLAERKLIIKKEGGHYNLSWLNDGKITAAGRGIELDGKLAAGWINI